MAWNPFRFFSVRGDKSIENRTRKFFKALAGYTVFYRSNISLAAYKGKFADFEATIMKGDAQLTTTQLKDLLERLSSILNACTVNIRYDLIVLHRRQEALKQILGNVDKVERVQKPLPQNVQKGLNWISNVIGMSADAAQDIRTLIVQKAENIRNVFRSYSTTTSRRSAINAMKEALSARSEVKENIKLVADLNGAIYSYLTNKDPARRERLIQQMGTLLKDIADNYGNIVHQMHSQIKNTTQIIDFINGEIAELYRYVEPPGMFGNTTGGLLCQKGFPPQLATELTRHVEAVEEERAKILRAVAGSADIVRREAQALKAAA